MLKNLIKYYTEIIERDMLEQVRFPAFKDGEDFITNKNASDELPTLDGNIILDKNSTFFKKLTLTANSSSVYYGWPIYARKKIAKKENTYTSLEPLFLLKCEYSSADSKLILVKAILGSMCLVNPWIKTI